MLTRDKFNHYLDQVLEIMHAQKEPHADTAVEQLGADLSERDAGSLANAAFFAFEEYERGR